jgi:hypothetical protein
MTTAPQVPMADVGEMYLVHTKAVLPLAEKYITAAEWVQMPIWRMQ